MVFCQHGRDVLSLGITRVLLGMDGVSGPRGRHDDEKSLQSRLSRISTVWTMLGEAERPAADAASSARTA